MKIVVGLDPSYKRTGLAICVDGRLKRVRSICFDGLTCNSQKRRHVREEVSKVLDECLSRSSDVTVVVEKIRLASQGFLNIDYIKGIGAMNALIVDVAWERGIKVFSVDTRAWKSKIVGTSKKEENELGVDAQKWPTIKYVISCGFEDSLLKEVSARSKKGVVKEDDSGRKYIYDDDAADAACIALYGFVSEHERKLEEEH